MNLKFNSLHTVNYRVEYEIYLSLLLLLYYKMTELFDSRTPLGRVQLNSCH